MFWNCSFQKVYRRVSGIMQCKGVRELAKKDRANKLKSKAPHAKQTCGAPGNWKARRSYHATNFYFESYSRYLKLLSLATIQFDTQAVAAADSPKDLTAAASSSLTSKTVCSLKSCITADTLFVGLSSFMSPRRFRALTKEPIRYAKPALSMQSTPARLSRI